MTGSETGWLRALDVVAEERVVAHEEHSIAYRAWESRGTKGIVLIHGGGAHAHWWDHIAPVLAERYRVIAVDLAGHGESSHLPAYGLSSWATGVMAAVSDAGLPARSMIVGHSLGGWVAAELGTRGGFGGLMMIDTKLDLNGGRRKAGGGPRPRRYQTRTQAIEHFRLIPEQLTTVEPELFKHVAETSVRPVDDGWEWKFDPEIFTFERPGLPLLQRVRCPAVLVVGEYGIVRQEDHEPFLQSVPTGSRVLPLPGASHHALLDQPEALTQLIEAQAAECHGLIPGTGRDWQ